MLDAILLSLWNPCVSNCVAPHALSWFAGMTCRAYGASVATNLLLNLSGPKYALPSSIIKHKIQHCWCDACHLDECSGWHMIGQSVRWWPIAHQL